MYLHSGSSGSGGSGGGSGPAGVTTRTIKYSIVLYVIVSQLDYVLCIPYFHH